MKLSPILGLPIAEPDDFTTNYPVEVDDPRTTALEGHTVMRFADAAARDAAITAPVAGMMVYLAAESVYQTYSGTAWANAPERAESLGLPAQPGSVLLLASILSDAAGNADHQFAPYVFAAPPIVAATPIHATAQLTCVLRVVDTTRAYVQVQDMAGAAVAGVTVGFIVIGRFV